MNKPLGAATLGLEGPLPPLMQHCPPFSLWYRPRGKGAKWQRVFGGTEAACNDDMHARINQRISGDWCTLPEGKVPWDLLTSLRRKPR